MRQFSELSCLTHICGVSVLWTTMSARLQQKKTCVPPPSVLVVRLKTSKCLNCCGLAASCHFLDPDHLGCNYDAKSIVVHFSAASRHLRPWPEVGRVSQRVPRLKKNQGSNSGRSAQLLTQFTYRKPFRLLERMLLHTITSGLISQSEQDPRPKWVSPLTK